MLIFSQIKSTIEVGMMKSPMTMTYKIALANFHNKVNSKFLNDPVTPHRLRRGISHLRVYTRRRRYQCKGLGGRGFWGIPTCGGRGNLTRKMQDDSFITLTDGSVIKYHPSSKFVDNTFSKFKQVDKKKLFNDRAQCKRVRAMGAMTTVYHQPNIPMLAQTSHWSSDYIPM